MVTLTVETQLTSIDDYLINYHLMGPPPGLHWFKVGHQDLGIDINLNMGLPCADPSSPCVSVCLGQ